MIYLQNCSGCHGAKGELQTTADFAQAEFRRGLEEQPDYFLWRISEGKPTTAGFSMPAFKSVLTEREQWQVLTFLRSLSDIKTDN